MYQIDNYDYVHVLSIYFPPLKTACIYPKRLRPTHYSYCTGIGCPVIHDILLFTVLNNCI